MVLICAFVALTLSVSEVLSLQVCGKNLADMLDLVCDGRGFHWTSGDNIPRIDKRTALQYLNSEPSNNRRSTGVVNECCNRPCTISHLESYCAAGQGTYMTHPAMDPVPREAAQMLLSAVRPPSSREITTPPPTTDTPLRMTQMVVQTTPRPSAYRCRRVINGIRMPCFRSTFFFVRPVGPRPTRIPVL